jgi:hypothetical protein
MAWQNRIFWRYAQTFFGALSLGYNWLQLSDHSQADWEKGLGYV